MPGSDVLAQPLPRHFLLVVGGGSAGVAAALGAARRGVSVILVEPLGLGGTSTLGGVNTWEPGIAGPGLPYEFYRALRGHGGAVALSRTVKDWTDDKPWSYSATVPEDSAAGIDYFKTLRRAGLRVAEMLRVTFEPAALSRVMEDALRATGRTTILSGWRFLDCAVQGSRIESVRLGQGSRTMNLCPALVVDATAQLHVAVAAGCETAIGGESRDEYGEPSAPEVPQVQINGATLCFRVRRRDTPAIDSLPADVPTEAYPCSFSITEYPNRDLNINALPLMQGVEFHRMPADKARREMESRLRRTWFWLQKEKGFDAYELAEIFPLVGVREGPRLVGRHVLTESEIRLGCARQGNEDSWIALADHALDVHGESGLCRELDAPYGIPYGCLLPRGLDNLAVACRGASFTHIAASSCRLSRTMMGLGHAAGIASALSMEASGRFPDISPAAIQRELASDDVSLDPADPRFGRRPGR